MTNYETVMTDAKFLKKFDWSLLIVDEAHRLKNSESKLCLAFEGRISLGPNVAAHRDSDPETPFRSFGRCSIFIQPDTFKSCSAFEAEWG